MFSSSSFNILSFYEIQFAYLMSYTLIFTKKLITFLILLYKEEFSLNHMNLIKCNTLF